MKKWTLAFAAMVLLAAAPALAEYPDDCLGEGEPSGSDCAGITFEGCCDDLGNTLWCDEGQLFCLSCTASEAFCGWMADAGWYGCNLEETGADPSGEFPLDCTPCDPPCGEGEICEDGICVECNADCTDKECGSDGCGGTCGQCGAGQVCNESSVCEDLPECVVGQEVFCGDVIESTTVDVENLLDDYSCTTWDESGGEVGFLFSGSYLPEGVTEDNVIVTIEYDDDGDLDIFALENACTVNDCIDNGNTEVDITVSADGTYYFVVDGYGGASNNFTLSVICISTCEPVCTDGPCSDNGCKGLCPCDTDGDVCYQGDCCTPSCDGKECGDDGCGGSCGACGEGTACDPADGLCKTPTCEGFCGDASPFGCYCDELCFEYGDCCEDVCDHCLEFEQCADLTNCGDGTCDAAVGENCTNCADDCLCEGEGDVCFEGACCTPVCDGKECGNDGCGGSCGECGPGMGCSDGTCVESTGPEECLGPNEPSADSCPDGMTYEGCCDDLGRVLWCDQGVLFCIDCASGNPECGWQGSFYDCGGDGSEDPSGAFPLECTPAVPCDPACSDGEKCVNGECVACVPDCDGKSCGDDGCGGTCGQCPDGAQCVEGGCHAGPGCEVEEGPGCGGCACETCVCELDNYCCDTQYDDICAGICISECGGCPVDPVENCGNGTCDAGEDCGNCAADCGCADGLVCEAGECVEETCTPDCTDKVCGDDGCEGSCGECADGESCVEGACQCTPMCDGKECGDDGCGATCGTCDAGFSCEEGLCIAEIEADVVTSADVVTPADGIEQPGDTTGEEPTKEKSGCTTSDSGSPLAMMLFLSMLLAIVAIRRVNA